MSSFLNVLFTMELAVANTNLSTTPVNDVPAENTLAATTVYYNNSFQVATTPTTIPIPPPLTETQILYVKNLDSINTLNLSFTPAGGSATLVVLPSGAEFIYFNPAVAGGGIGSISAEALGATINAEVFMGY